MMRDELRHIPSVNEIRDKIHGLSHGSLSSTHALNLAKVIQKSVRSSIISGSADSAAYELEWHLNVLREQLAGSRYSPVINGTGVVVHTNLGRAPVSPETARSMAHAAESAVALEIEATTGQRGGRMREISWLVQQLTGAEAALVVNNNAAAVLLTLSSLAAGEQVVVSRAEAVEIGGGFRIPDVLQQSGAELVEIGTTNRTYAADYRTAADAGAKVILKVHSSNFAISGFVTSPSLQELHTVASETDSLLIEDLGSGTLLDTAAFGIEHEPTIQESIAAGADVVTFSGDKLLGGPQAGIIAGKAELVERIAGAPLARAVRADKAALAGIATTLRHYLKSDAVDQLPVWRMIASEPPRLQERAEALIARLDEDDVQVRSVSTTNFIGGGSLPGQAQHGVALAVSIPGVAADELAQRLRLAKPVAVYGRIEQDQLLVELRTVLPEYDDRLVEIMRSLVPRT